MTWPLQGRSHEVEQAAALLDDPAAGGVVIVGAAGVGRTRMAAEIAELATARGCAVAWARATRSASRIPLGALAALLPTGAAGAELLVHARHALLERAGGRRLVLCVDDGELLDDASAAFVHQLVSSGTAFAVVAVRRGAPVPDALRALWKDEGCPLLELEPLAPEEVERVLAAALGGPVDGRSLDALWRLSLGNPLFLHELVLHGSARGLLDDDDGIWRWRGDVRPGTRLAELVEARLEALGPAERALMEVVAVGAPLEVGLLEPGERVALDRLERAELVTSRLDQRRRSAEPSHPLHGEVVRSRMTETRLEEIRRRLADAVGAHGMRRRGDLLRVATWRLESGGGADGALFVRASGLALTALDVPLAERFARAAVRASGGFDAELALGRALAGAGRAPEAQELLGRLEARAAGDEQRAAVAIAMARNLFWALDRADDADEALRRAEAAVGEDGRREELQALRIRLAVAGGRPREALATALPLLDDDSVSEQARVQAAVAAGEALLSSGRIAEAVAVIETWAPVARRQREALPVAERVLLSEHGFALRFAGRLRESTALTDRTYGRAVEYGSPQTTAVEATALGFVWLARGRVRTALRYFNEGASLLRDVDAVGMLAWALAGVAQATAQAGDAAAAHRAVEELERHPLGHKGFAFEIGLARAWAAAAPGALSTARGFAGEAAEHAERRGQDALAVRAWHELCRLGDAVSAAPALTRLAERVEGPFAADAAAHAAALLAGDGRLLLAAAERFATQDALLLAAEAGGGAAAAHRDAGREASARAAAARAAVWLEACEGARPPTLAPAPEADELTAREREIAMLAATGLTSREIAERLVVSVRTVDNHLQRAYRKLGVTRRQELPDTLVRGG